MRLAWHVAALERQKTLPKLKTLLAVQGTPVVTQSATQHMTILGMLGFKGYQTTTGDAARG